MWKHARTHHSGRFDGECRCPPQQHQDFPGPPSFSQRSSLPCLQTVGSAPIALLRERARGSSQQYSFQGRVSRRPRRGPCQRVLGCTSGRHHRLSRVSVNSEVKGKHEVLIHEGPVNSSTRKRRSSAGKLLQSTACCPVCLPT